MSKDEKQWRVGRKTKKGSKDNTWLRDRIYEYVDRNKILMKEFFGLMGVTDVFFYKIMSGEKKCPIWLVIKLARILEFPTELIRLSFHHFPPDFLQACRIYPQIMTQMIHNNLIDLGYRKGEKFTFDSQIKSARRKNSHKHRKRFYR